MVKVFTVDKIRKADQYTIDNEPTTSIELMERAANRAFEFLYKSLLKGVNKLHFTFFCGIGNNGGDGLVMARRCQDAGIAHKLYVVELSEDYSDDFEENLKLYRGTGGKCEFLNSDQSEFELQAETTVVDCIFGTGLNRKVEGFATDVIQQINEQTTFTVAVDIPSGLFAEDNNENEAHLIVQADYTLSFQFPKLAFFFPQNEVFVGNWHLIDIGLHPQYIRETRSDYAWMERTDISSMLIARPDFSHKGTYGHALLMSGSEGKFGAAILAAKAALRSGLGLLSLQIARMGNDILQSTVPEAMVVLDEAEKCLSEFKGGGNYSALGIGPGIGQSEETINLLKRLIQESTIPMLLDADALNILAKNPTWLSFLPANTILTPHPGEFKRLAGKWGDDYERLQKQIDFAKKYQIYVILKGRYTSVVSPEGKVFFNSTGNSGMAKGGSGDALSGIITSLLAQGYHTQEACILGVYVHGLAGDIAAQEKGKVSMLPSDLIEALPQAFQELDERDKN
jgi:NAD(P)H-hydrate epimerase